LLRKNGEPPLVATPHLVLTHALDQFHPRSRFRTSRLAVPLRSGLLVGATAALTVGLLPGTAAAVPDEATTPEQAARLVAEASHELEVVTEQVNEAREKLDQQEAASEEAKQAAAEARAELTALDGQMREIARTAYTGDNPTEFDLLLTSDSADDFVSSLGTLDAIAEHTSDLVDEVALAAGEAEDAQAAADAAAAEAERLLDEITTDQAKLEREIADFQAQYDALTAEQRRLVSETHAGVAVAAPAPAPAPVAAANGSAVQAAMNTALGQVGDAYVWGAAGPNAFDCSGLMQYAYAAAGVSLPHSSRMQSQLGAPVSRGQLQPGDLLFYFSPVSHVGMYIGNGQMVHASTPGTPVRVVSIDSMGSFTSARRIT
jgi:cell wall-associated NlpC family hydrolase